MKSGFKNLCTLLATLSFGVASAPSNAATSVSTMNVNITLDGTCEVKSQRDLKFGLRGYLNTRRDRFAGIQVRCSASLPYDIGLNEGLSPSGTTSIRQMTKGAETIDYLLFQEVARTTNWGNSVGIDTKSATGDGKWQKHRIYGRVPPQATPSPGLYSDIITVTVTY